MKVAAVLRSWLTVQVNCLTDKGSSTVFKSIGQTHITSCRPFVLQLWICKREILQLLWNQTSLFICQNCNRFAFRLLSESCRDSGRKPLFTRSSVFKLASSPIPNPDSRIQNSDLTIQTWKFSFALLTMVQTIVVIGATGVQGGGVVSELLKDGLWNIRAVTRNPESDKGKALTAQGVKVVTADLDNTESLIKAFEVSYCFLLFPIPSLLTHKGCFCSLRLDQFLGACLYRWPGRSLQDRFQARSQHRQSCRGNILSRTLHLGHPSLRQKNDRREIHCSSYRPEGWSRWVHQRETSSTCEEDNISLAWILYY